jgi:hypothetical protein
MKKIILAPLPVKEGAASGLFSFSPARHALFSAD